MLGDIPIHIVGIPCMTDTKVKKAWTEELEGRDRDTEIIASTGCYGCDADYKEMSLRHHPKFEKLKPEAKALCMTNCHVKTCTFNWLIKCCTYRSIKGYRVRNDEDKRDRAKFKEEMVKAFWDRLKLPVCQVREKSGTSNTGPTVKEAFRHLEELSEIMYCPLNLLEGLKTVFEVLDSGKILNAQRFKAHCDKWLDDFHGGEIAWNILSPTLHFIFHHGFEVMEILVLLLKLPILSILHLLLFSVLSNFRLF